MLHIDHKYLFFLSVLLISCSTSDPDDNTNNDTDNPVSNCNPKISTNSPNSDWFVSYNGSGEESHGHFILSCSDGGYLQVGETGFIPNTAKILVVKISADGKLLWQTEIGQKGHNLGNAALETDQNYIIVGSVNENAAFISLNKNTGAIVNSKSHNHGGSDAYEAIAETPTGFIAVGYNNAEDRGNTFFTEGQGLIAFLDANGTLINSQSINSYIAHAYRVKAYNSKYIISGLTEGAEDYALININGDGTLNWHSKYGGTSSDHNFGMDIDASGSIFLTGHTLSNTENWDTYTIKIDTNGTLLWESKQGNPRGFDPRYIHDETWDIKSTNDGGCIIVAGSGDEYESYDEYCSQTESSSNQWVVYLIKYSELGQIEWQQIYQSNAGNDWAGEAITLSVDGGAVVAVDNGNFGFLKINSL